MYARETEGPIMYSTQVQCPNGRQISIGIRRRPQYEMGKKKAELLFTLQQFRKTIPTTSNSRNSMYREGRLFEHPLLFQFFSYQFELSVPVLTETTDEGFLQEAIYGYILFLS